MGTIRVGGHREHGDEMGESRGDGTVKNLCFLPDERCDDSTTGKATLLEAARRDPTAFASSTSGIFRASTGSSGRERPTRITPPI